MKRMLSLLLIFLLFIQAPLQNMAYAESCSYPNDPDLQSQVGACNQVPGQEWICRANRCLTSKVANDTKNKFAQCEQIAEGPARNDCYTKVAIEATKQESGIDPSTKADFEGWVKGARLTVQTLAAFHIATSFVLMKKGKSSGMTCPSMLLYVAGGIVGIMGEVYNYFILKNKAEELAMEYQSKQFLNQQDAQVQAFEYLAREQDEMKKVAKNKSLVYKVEAGIYATVAVLAALEATGVMKCMPKKDGSKDTAAKKDGAKTPDAKNPTTPANGTTPASSPTKELPAGTQLNLQPVPAGAFLHIPILQQHITMAPTALLASVNFLEGERYLKGEKSSLSLTEYSSIQKDPGLLSLREFNTEETNLFKMALSMTLQVAFPEAQAASSKKSEGIMAVVAPMIGAAGGLLFGQIISKSEALSGPFGDFLTSPWSRVIMAGISAAVAVVLFQAADKQVAMAEQNAKLLRKTQLGFSKSVTGYCNTHLDQNDPNCYCTLANGERDPNRTNSDICKNFWMAQDKNSFQAAGTYDDAVGGAAPVGCMTRQGEFDPMCKCNQIKDTTGGNNCLKSDVQINLGGVGKNLGVPATVDGANGLISGNTTGSNINATASGNNALKLGKAAEDLLNQHNDSLLKAGQTQIPFGALATGALKKMASPLSSQQVNNELSGGAGNLARDSRDLLNSNPLFAKAIAEADKRSGITNLGVYENAGLRKPNSNTEVKNSMNINLSGSGAGSKDVNVTEFEGGKSGDYNYRSSDIASNPDAPLWDIISKRYQQSGYRLLFEKEAVK